jgi:phospholipase/carboxylesterase
MSEPNLRTVEIHPGREADSAVIWLHGLGADGHDFAPVASQLGLPDHLAPRFVFPHAPAIAVTLNGGMVMPAWYDIVSLDTRGHDEEGVARSCRQSRPSASSSAASRWAARSPCTSGCAIPSASPASWD